MENNCFLKQHKELKQKAVAYAPSLKTTEAWVQAFDLTDHIQSMYQANMLSPKIKRSDSN